MAASVVVSSILFATDELLRMEELTVCAITNLVEDIVSVSELEMQ